MRPLIGLSLALAAGSTQAQTSRTVPDALACARCMVMASQVFTIGASDDVFLSSAPGGITVDSQNRLWLIPDEGPPLVFGSDGKFLGQVGRAGTGPGEYAAPVGLLSVGDSVVVIDAGTARATVVGPNLSPSRSLVMTVPVGEGVAVQWPRNIVLTGYNPTPVSIGWPLHHATFAGREATVVRSYGPDDGEARYGSNATHSHLVSHPRNQHYWSADRYSYRLTRWSEAHQRELTLYRRPTWFSKPTEHPGFGNRTVPPPPSIAAIEEDENGLLWVFIRLASPTWRDGWANAATEGRETLVRSIALEKLFVTMIEVIDPQNGAVVARGRVPYWVTHALPKHRAAAYKLSENGETPIISIVQFAIVGRSQ